MEEPRQNPEPQPDDEKVIPPSNLVGQMFGRFRCTRKLGQGAMATVLLGEDIALKRPAALKLLPRANKSNPHHRVWLDQFIREARAAAQLVHSGIIQVYEVGLHAGYFYIAMEAVLGGSLDARVKKSGPIPVAEAMDYILQTAEALAFAHQRGVLHRDIKPANILLTETGQCKLGDFGMAVIDDPTDKFKLPSNWVGTPYFMAPEVLARKSSSQSDIYALGATLWYLLTAQHPYAIKELRDVTYVGERIPLGNLRKLCPKAPPALGSVLAKALARNPEDRYTSVMEMAEALRKATVPTGLEALAAATMETRNGNSNRRPAAPRPGAPLARPAAGKTRPASPPSTSSATKRWRWIGGIAGAAIAATVVTLLIVQPWQSGPTPPSPDEGKITRRPSSLPIAASIPATHPAVAIVVTPPPVTPTPNIPPAVPVPSVPAPANHKPHVETKEPNRNNHHKGQAAKNNPGRKTPPGNVAHESPSTPTAPAVAAPATPPVTASPAASVAGGGKLLAYDPFDGKGSDKAQRLKGGTGWSSDWTVTDEYTVEPESLSYTDSRGAKLVVSGGKMVFPGSKSRNCAASRKLDLFAERMKDGKPLDIWFSCLLLTHGGARDITPWSDDTNGPFSRGANTHSYNGLTGWTQGKDTAHPDKVITKSSFANLLICHLAVRADLHSFVWTWYVNPTNLSDPLNSGAKVIWGASNPAGTLKGLTGFCIRSQSDGPPSRFELDEIRYGETAASVTPYVAAGASSQSPPAAAPPQE